MKPGDLVTFKQRSFHYEKHSGLLLALSTEYYWQGVFYCKVFHPDTGEVFEVSSKELITLCPHETR